MKAKAGAWAPIAKNKFRPARAARGILLETGKDILSRISGTTLKEIQRGHDLLEMRNGSTGRGTKLPEVRRGGIGNRRLGEPVCGRIVAILVVESIAVFPGPKLHAASAAARGSAE
ncbi:MAG: hypothetical protein WBE76_03645, partial [Terracidiphilus sp.]